MIDFWLRMADRGHLIKSWSWGMLYGFFYENSIYDGSNLYYFIEDYFKDATINRHLNIGLANVLNGQYKSFKEHHPADEMI